MTLEDWKVSTIKNMQAWLKTHRQAVNRRNKDFFEYDVSEYFQFAEVTDGRTDGDID